MIELSNNFLYMGCFYNSMQSIEISNNQKGIMEDILLTKLLDLTINGKGVILRTDPTSEQAELELRTSIQKDGLLNPIIVRSIENGYFEVISGKRRVKAFRKLGLRKIFCHVIDADDKNAFEISLIENIQSIKISPLEEAIAFKLYVDEFGWGGISDLANRISKSVSYVHRRIQLLDLSDQLKDDIINGKLKPSLANELLSIKDNDKQSDMAIILKDGSTSLREFRHMVKKAVKNNSPTYNHLPIEEDDEIPRTIRMVDVDEKTQRSFDQAIVAIRLSMNKLSSIIKNNEDNWIVYETLMQHKRVLHEQVDILYKEKKKLRI